MSKNIGVIYILTNPSFLDYVKIGYTYDINKRLAQLIRSEKLAESYYLSSSERKLLDVSNPIQESLYFTYKDKVLVN